MVAMLEDVQRRLYLDGEGLHSHNPVRKSDTAE